MITTNVLEEDGVTVEIVGVVGVGFDGSFVHRLGPVVITTHIMEEPGVVAEAVGVEGVGFDGSFVHRLRSVVITTNEGYSVGVCVHFRESIL